MYLLHQHHLRHALDPCLDPLFLPNLAQPRPHMHVRGRDKKKSSPEAQESAEEDAALVAPAPATNMPKTSSSQSTVAMLSQGRGVGEGAFQRALGAHGSAAGWRHGSDIQGRIGPAAVRPRQGSHSWVVNCEC